MHKSQIEISELQKRIDSLENARANITVTLQEEQQERKSLETKLNQESELKHRFASLYNTER